MGCFVIELFEYDEQPVGVDDLRLVAMRHPVEDPALSLPGEPRRDDDVIAVGWDRWVPAAVIDGLIEGLVAAREGAFR